MASGTADAGVGRDSGGGGGVGPQGGVSGSCPGEVLANRAWMTAAARWRSKVSRKAFLPLSCWKKKEKKDNLDSLNSAILSLSSCLSTYSAQLSSSFVCFFFCFSPPSLSPSLSYNHTHTGISGIYRGVVIGLFFDARWEITGPRNRDKSTSETRVSALAYDLQTLARTSIAHVPGRPECTDAQQEHTCSTSVREENG